MATTVENGSETVKPGSATEDLQSAISNGQSQIDLLADLCKRLQTLRQLPSGVLRSELVLAPNQVLQMLTLKDIFGKSAEDLRTLHAAAMEGKVQDALRAAAESERRDGSEIKDARERDNQKRRCVSCLFFFAFRALFSSPLRSLFVASWCCALLVVAVQGADILFFFFMLQPLSDPRIPETVSALTTKGCESVPPASCGYDAAHAQRPAVIRPGVQLYACEEDAAAPLLAAGARGRERRRSCGAEVPYP